MRDIQLPLDESGNFFFRQHRILASILDRGWYDVIALLVELFEPFGYHIIVLLQSRIKRFFIDELKGDVRFHFDAVEFPCTLQSASNIIGSNS